MEVPLGDESFYLPPLFAIDESVEIGTIRQLILPSCIIEASIEEYPDEDYKGFIIHPTDGSKPIFITLDDLTYPQEFTLVLSIIKLDKEHLSKCIFSWIKHPLLEPNSQSQTDYAASIQEVQNSWYDSFFYKREDTQRQVPGLRSPQIGAIHAAHAHWVTTDQPATIVMPTGTGKTEVMLSILVSMQCERVLVVVPTDALRTQISNKFLTLGLLRELGIISQDVKNPIVGILKHRPKRVDDVVNFFQKCNVIISTIHIAGQCNSEIQNQIAKCCSYLFIDEAHHVAASTWNELKTKFSSKRILQFTATPFRNDGKLIGGKIIFNYPLKKALEEEYFKKINFTPVMSFDIHEADVAIAEKAINQLREDLKTYDHILMARVNNIERAQQAYSIYQKYKEFNPVQIHTGIKPYSELEKIRKMIINKETRIIICVDMLGEGFDLPELKIAALHDIKKSLAVTLQLIGRFTREKNNLGDPTFIANIGCVDVKDELKNLYIQDADWNTILVNTSEEAIQEQISFREFLDGFQKFPNEIAIQNIKPALSTAIYKTRCSNWHPNKFKNGIAGHENIERIEHVINHQEKTMVIVTARKLQIDWANIQDIYNWDWELIIIHWDEEQNLLFINSSSNSSYYKDLAKAVGGEDIELISGPFIFRCFTGINRLRLQNVGLSEQLGRLIRYTMRAGSDVETGLTDAQMRNTKKSNIFGNGYENGYKASIGCTYKGRVWSQQKANIESLVKWCRQVGKKILDENVDPDEFLRGTLTSIAISAIPEKIPFSIEWPEEIYKYPETAYELTLEDKSTLHLYEIELSLDYLPGNQYISFYVKSENKSIKYCLDIFQKNNIKDFSIFAADDKQVVIKKSSSQLLLEGYFQEYPPIIYFTDGSTLEGNMLTELKKSYEPYNVSKIICWDWAGVNIEIESQKAEKRTNSVQYKVIHELMNKDYNIIFDDDDSGEAADVIGIRMNDNSIDVDFYHCKYSGAAKPGARVDDLYIVCGQAQKCVHLMDNFTKLFQHMVNRETKSKGGRNTRFEKGCMKDLMKIIRMSNFLKSNLSVHIVQPGLSKHAVSQNILELLSVTENYLMETYKIPFYVIASL